MIKKKIILLLLLNISVLYSQSLRTTDILTPLGGQGLFIPFNFTPVTPISDTNTYPLTRFGNGYISFDMPSHKQFMRTRDLHFAEFIFGITDSFRIQTRIAIRLPRVPTGDIAGKHNGSAGSWILGFGDNFGANYLEFYLNGWDSIVNIGTTDTNWHTVEIRWHKSDSLFMYYYDDALVWTRKKVWVSSANVNAFNIGNRGSSTSIADPTAVPIANYGNMKMDYFYLKKNNDSAIYYNFNEGAGQYGYDSLDYIAFDRSYPDGSYLGNHITSGWNVSPDSQDVTWWQGTAKTTTNIVNLGTGLWDWVTGISSFAESYTNGLTIWQGNIVPTARFNRVNVTLGTWTHNGDTADGIGKWNGSTWSKIGTNGSFFNIATQNIVQGFDWHDTLIAGGTFTDVGDAFGDYIKRFDGSTWSSMDSGFDADVYCMGINTNDKLIVGGGLNASGGTAIISGVAQWDYGTWTPVGTNDIASVWALKVFNGKLYCGATSGLYSLEGSTWTLVAGTSGTVYWIELLGSEIWCGGTVGLIWKYNGTTLTLMGTATGFTTHVIDAKAYRNDLYVMGSFYRIHYNSVGTVVNKLARWNGREWSAVNYGFDLRGEDIDTVTFSAQKYLVITGDHYNFDGVPSNNISLIPLNY